MNAASMNRRAAELQEIYRGTAREYLKPELRGFFRSVEFAFEEMEKVRKHPDPEKRGSEYLQLMIALLAVSEAVLTAFTGVELHFAQQSGKLPKGLI